MQAQRRSFPKDKAACSMTAALDHGAVFPSGAISDAATRRDPV